MGDKFLYKMDQSERTQIYYDLYAYFRRAPFKTCRDTLNNLITEGKFLGKGNYGTVNLETINDGEQQGRTVVFKKSSFSKKIDIIREIYGLSACNIAIVNKICPSFPFTYKYGLCQPVSGEPYYYFIQEQFDHTLEKYRIVNEKTLTSVLTQGIMAIKTLLDLEIVHDDIRAANIMMKKTNDKYYNYKFGDHTYTIDTDDHLLALIDFGISRNTHFAKFKQEHEPSFKDIGEKYHSALAKLNGYSSDLISLLKTIYSHTDETVSASLMVHKYNLRIWAEEIIHNQFKSIDDFMKSVNAHLPAFMILKTEEPTGRGFNLNRTEALQKTMKEELYAIANSLFEKDEAMKLILQYYITDAKTYDDIVAMINRSRRDYDQKADVKSFLQGLTIIPPTVNDPTSTNIVSANGDVILGVPTPSSSGGSGVISRSTGVTPISVTNLSNNSQNNQPDPGEGFVYPY